MWVDISFTWRCLINASTACTCFQSVCRASVFSPAFYQDFQGILIWTAFGFPPPASVCELDAAEADSRSAELLSSPMWKRSCVWTGSGVGGVIPQLFSELQFSTLVIWVCVSGRRWPGLWYCRMMLFWFLVSVVIGPSCPPGRREGHKRWRMWCCSEIMTDRKILMILFDLWPTQSPGYWTRCTDNTEKVFTGFCQNSTGIWYFGLMFVKISGSKSFTVQRSLSCG